MERHLQILAIRGHAGVISRCDDVIRNMMSRRANKVVRPAEERLDGSG
jgi:hypothetical protein